MAKEKYPPEYKQFYSNDPYEVLGVPTAATRQEIDKARKKLLRKFHPDVNKDALATEISQNINQAFDRLEGGQTGGGFSSRSSTHHRTETYEPPRPRQSHTREHEHTRSSGYSYTRRETRQETPSEMEEQLFRALNLGAKQFREYVINAKAKGMKADRIAELIKSERAQKSLKSDFLTKVRVWGSDNPAQVSKHMNEWKEAGVDLSGFLNSPEIRKDLEHYALIKITIWGAENPDKFLAYINAWKNLGIDLSNVANSREAKDFLTHQAVKINIAIWGKDSPEKFVKFVNAWKKAGVDLTDLVNSPEGQNELTFSAKLKAQYHPAKFKTYVEAWVKAGWKPSAEIVALLQKVK